MRRINRKDQTMKKQDRIRICGARKDRLAKRILLGGGLMALYSICFGLAPGLLMILIWIGLAAATARAFYSARHQRRIRREQQIATEVIEMDPEPSREALRAAYGQRRQKELRLEAGWYVCFAVAVFLWVLGLYGADASPLSWIVGMLGLVPALLLVALGLFIGSFKDQTPDATPTIDAYLADTDLQQIMLARHVRPDHRREGDVMVLQAEAAPADEDVARLVREKLASERSSPGTIVGYVIAVLFFVVVPGLLFLLTLPMLLMRHEMGWLSLLMGIVSLPGILGSVYFLRNRKLSRRPERRKLLQAGAYSVERDRVLSAIRDENEAFSMEVCFDRLGTVKLKDRALQGWLLEKPAREMLLLTRDKEVLAAVFQAEQAPEAAASNESGSLTTEDPAAEGAPAQAPAQTGAFLTDEQIRQAAEKRLAAMDPAQREKEENEFRRYLELSHRAYRKGLDAETKAERQERDLIGYGQRQKLKAMEYDIQGIESEVMERLHASREEIYHMKKNPYVKGMLVTLAIGVAVGIVGNLLTALIEKLTGADLRYLYVILSSLSGLIALAAAGRLMNIFRFRKLQRTYQQPAFWDRLIDAEMYRLLYDQFRQEQKAEATD